MQEVALSGMRPTGRLHIGHLEAVLKQWVQLQKDAKCFYFVADWHALTTDTNTKEIKPNSIQMVKDWIAYGINPEKSTIFCQSMVPQHAELSTILSMFVNLGRLERLPTFNEYIVDLQQKKDGEKRNYDEVKRAKVSLGFLGYPVLQSADILLYNANLVPVGEDQLPHIELTRELARKFNSMYGSALVVPEPRLGKSTRILGYDGRKMSKSLNNTINPSDSYEQLEEKIRKIKPDENKKGKTDVGNPYECKVFDLHEIYTFDLENVRKECMKGERGCFECKLESVSNIVKKYEQFNENRFKITNEQVINVLVEGSKHAAIVASETVDRVKDAMNMNYGDALEKSRF